MVDKLIVVGCGGIGSNFVTNVVNAICADQIDIKEIEIYDDDKIELKNKLYTTFECSPDQLGKSKVQVIKDDLNFILEMNGKTCKIVAREEKFQQGNLNDFSRSINTILVSTVDGSKFRSDLLKTVGYNKSRHWIDMRSHGGRVLIFRNPTDQKEQDLLEPYFVDRKVENASCQRPEDLAKKIVQYGNKIIAMVGLQYLTNVDRGLINQLIFDGDFSGQNNK